MFDSMADWMSVPLLHWTCAGKETARHGLAHASIYPYAPFHCSDGDVIVAIQQPAEWRRFCSGVLERPELANDSRFAVNPQRVANRIDLAAIINGVFGALTCAEAIDRLEANAIAWGRVSDVPAVAAHPAFRVLDVPLSGGGHAAVPRPAGRDVFEPGPVPQLGEHTGKIRAEFAA